MIKKAVIFGASDTGKRIYEDIKNENTVIAFLDENSAKFDRGGVGNIPVYPPEAIVTMDYDVVYIGVLTFYKRAMQLLQNYGVPKEKIVQRYVETAVYARIECLKSVRELLEEEKIITGAVAELGVYQGEFAKEINKVFFDRKLYLFDTFEGFSDKDCEEEMKKGYLNHDKKGYFSNTTEERVMNQMPHKENVIIKKGFFPNTAQGLEESFCFVNLDADLYAPTFEGLKYFYPRMETGGVIFVHDYFSKAFKGARAAVKEFCLNNNVKYVPIGDTLSIAIRR